MHIRGATRAWFGGKMVRSYKRKTSTSYTNEALDAAVKAAKEHQMTRSQAAKKYNISATTLFSHIFGKHSRVGAEAPAILSPAEEKELVTTIQVLQEIGFGLTKDLVSVVICDYLKDQPALPNPFKLGIPGQDWWRLLLKQWRST